MKVKIKLLHDEVPSPKRATKGASGFDLTCVGGHVLKPGDRATLPTGIAVAIPEGFEGQIRPRSSLSKRGIDVYLGTIDADYRGELKVVIGNNSGKTYVVAAGDRIAQLVICPVYHGDFKEVKVLDKTERGEGGFGSTGR